MKVYLVLLAAGDSKRFGSNKLLYEINGQKMYTHITDRLSEIDTRFTRMIVVSQYQEILDTLKERGYVPIYNNQSSLGISHSINLAINYIKSADPLIASEHDDGCAVMFCVCDQPFITTKTLRGLLDSFLIVPKHIACVSSNGKLGNPAIFNLSYSQELLLLTGDSGGKSIINNHPEDLYVYKVLDSHELEDIDILKGIQTQY